MRRLAPIVIGFILLPALASAANVRSASLNVSGAWRGSDGSTFVLNQQGKTVLWFAHAADGVTWVHDFQGTIQGNQIVGSWKDRGSGRVRQTGQLTLRIVDADHLRYMKSSRPWGGNNPNWSLTRIHLSLRLGVQLNPDGPFEPFGSARVGQRLTFQATVTPSLPVGTNFMIIQGYRDEPPAVTSDRRFNCNESPCRITVASVQPAVTLFKAFVYGVFTPGDKWGVIAQSKIVTVAWKS